MVNLLLAGSGCHSVAYHVAACQELSLLSSSCLLQCTTPVSEERDACLRLQHCQRSKPKHRRPSVHGLSARREGTCHCACLVVGAMWMQYMTGTKQITRGAARILLACRTRYNARGTTEGPAQTIDASVPCQTLVYPVRR